MIVYCLGKWYRNKSVLKEALLKDKELRTCEYKRLVELVVKYILNNSQESDDCEWNASKITEINDGDYEGTLLYVIPKECYQPEEYEYLMTFVSYGSCSGCDTLQGIQCYGRDDDVPIKDFMTLCRDIVSNIVKPFNTGWRNQKDFESVKMDENEDA